ncbi:MAG: ABC transporter permease [Clostridiaceae bacterium]|nr:ABC transporter permease [Clostridiaceae bacterium]
MTDPETKDVFTQDKPEEICPPAHEPLVCVIKEPLIRIAKRGVVSKRHKVMVYVVGFILAILVGALLLVLIGKNPINAYINMATGSFGTKTSAAETFRLAVPLLIAGVAIAFAFKMRFWNIGGEGQILAGPIFMSHVVVSVIHSGAQIGAIPLHILLIAAAITGGAFFGFLPALFKTRWGTNETLFTLMLNYIAIEYINYLKNLSKWKPPRTTFPKIINFKDSLSQIVLPKVFGVHIGWIFALALAFLAYLYLKKTKHGYEISAIGDSLNTARYAGMSTSWVQIRTLLISGALCGLAGYFQVAGADYTLTETTAGGVGFTAIIVAWMAKLNPFIMIPVSIFIAMLKKGSLAIQSTMKIPASAADLLTGIILFFMLGCELFLEYKLVFRHSQTEIEEMIEEVLA